MQVAAVSLFVFCALFQPVLLQPNEETEICPSFNCGKFRNISFPYSNIEIQQRSCGPFAVDGCDKKHQQIQLESGSEKFYQLESVTFRSPLESFITIIDTELSERLDSRNCRSFNNLSIPYLSYADLQIVSTQLITLWKCSQTVNFTSPLFECPDFNIFYNDINKPIPTPPTDCLIVQLPVNTHNSSQDIFELLTANFSLRVNAAPEDYFFCLQCELFGEGKCQKNISTRQLQCRGLNTWETKIPQRKKVNNNAKPKILIGIGTTVASIVLLTIIFCFSRRKFTFDNMILYWKKKTQESQSIEAFLKSHGSMALKRYEYTQVKKMTESFKDKLGQGGFGGVFKGKLPDGRNVAVKILKESKTNGEEFINEVASISRTSHVNIVTLLGFCYEGSKRALIYEFMSKGSLEKYTYKEKSSRTSSELGWATLHEIAVGVARGLEYLHRGCNTRILHFDIKPHNILLDENFCPKISDFGLAKICPGKESIISTFGARGTVGYIAPELFCRNFGGVSYKSDVYSYGMLVFEMVGARNKICVEGDNTSEIYFPDWIYKRLEIDEELGFCGIDSEEENQIARKLILVSLWCIQTSPSTRPPMCRVLEMLLGSVASLSIPPRPCWNSLSRSHSQLVANSSTINEDNNVVLSSDCA